MTSFHTRRHNPMDLMSLCYNPVVLALIVVILCVHSSSFAQGNEGRIMGAITDQGGNAIVDAAVTVTDLQRNITRTLKTDQSGEYNAPNLIPGTYKVRSEANGFEATERQNIVLEVGREIRVDLSLKTGEQTQTVLVTSAVPLTETTNVSVGGTLDNETISNLPLNGRNFQSLTVLRPGVTIYPGGGSWTQSTDGLRAHDQVFLVDGVNSNDPWLGMSVMNAALLAGDAGTLLPLDSIDEFKTEVNPAAQYGWRPGSVVDIGLKSGTNALHGTAYAYGRTDAFDARDYFNPSNGASAGPKVPLNLEQFGASLGGPVLKDKFFYFVNFEEQRYTVGSPAHHTVPITGGSAAAADATNGLQGACLAALAAGGGGVTPLSLQLAGLNADCSAASNYPGLFLPNSSDTANVNTSLNSTSQIDAGVVRADYHLTASHELHGSYFISPGTGTVVDDPPHQLYNSQLSVQYARSQVGSGAWVWTPNSFLVNEVRAGYAHYNQIYRTADSTKNPASYSYNGSTYSIDTGQTNPLFFGLPRIRISALPNFQLGATSFQNVGPDGIWDFVDHVSILHGKHNFMFGGEVLATSNNVIYPNGDLKGAIRFANLQSFFNGVPNQANYLSGDLQRNLTNQGYALFAQDSWRIRPRVTVSAGLRYEINTVLKDSRNLLGNFDPNRGLVQVGKQISSPFDGHHLNFSPRLGVAWDLRGDGKTVFRAGFNLMFEQLTNDVFGGLQTIPTGSALFANGSQIASPGTINALANSYQGPLLSGNTPGDLAYNWANNGSSVPLFSNTAGCGDGSVQYPTNSGFFPGPCAIRGVNPHLLTPYTTMWTINVQRALTKSMALEVAYVGNHGTHLISENNTNQSSVGSGWTPAAVSTCLTSGYSNCSPDTNAEQAARPFNIKFPYLSFVNILGNADISNYDGLQATLTQRIAYGLNLTAGYTYAHALDNNSDNWGIIKIPINNKNQLYSNSDFDIRNRLTVSANYNIPGKKGFAQLMEGWSVNSIVTMQTGLPWWVQDTSNDFSGTGEVSQPQSSEYEQWVFVGKPSDFTMKHGFTGNNGGVLTGGSGGVPFFPSSGDPLNPSTNQSCNVAARKLDGGATTGLAQAALFTTGCFALGNSLLIPPAYGTYGTTTRNIFRDTGFKNVDLSVSKAIKIKEDFSAQFRVEFFNVFNHPEFANPYGGPSGGAASDDPSVGAGFGCGCVTADEGGQNPVLGSGGPRAMQLGLKLVW
jgi:Carboxypeptidase regulatory-like domain/TonB dependent receptor